MSGVSPGSPVTAANTNQAFIDANGDDTGIGKYTLANTDPVSGTQIDNLQNELNSEASYTGKTVNTLKTDLPSWSSTDAGASTNNLTQRAEALTRKFNSNTGHAHTGLPGDGGVIQSLSIQSVPLEGTYIQGVDITGATGVSSDVSLQLAGQIASNSSVVKGIVVNSPYNLVFVRQASGALTNDEYKDASGNVVYGRLTFIAPVWTLSYFVRLSGTETAYTFPSAKNVRWYYQKLFDRIVDAPVYSDLSNIPSDNATADVITATTLLQGKTQLAITAQSIGSANSSGTPNAVVANADHVHQGVYSVQEFTEAVPNFGALVLKGSAAVTIARAGNTFTFDSPGGTVGYQESPLGLVNGINTSFGPLTFNPSNNNSVLVLVDGIALNKTDFTVTGTNLTLLTAPSLGQSLYVFYTTGGVAVVPPTALGVLRTEFRTVTALEAANQKIILSYTPADGPGLLADWIGSSAQVYNVDYTVVANEFRWMGYAGGFLQGDVLRFHYIT